MCNRTRHKRRNCLDICDLIVFIDYSAKFTWRQIDTRTHTHTDQLRFNSPLSAILRLLWRFLMILLPDTLSIQLIESRLSSQSFVIRFLSIDFQRSESNCRSPATPVSFQRHFNVTRSNSQDSANQILAEMPGNPFGHFEDSPRIAFFFIYRNHRLIVDESESGTFECGTNSRLWESPLSPDAALINTHSINK